MQKLLTFFFSKNISVYAIFNDQSFNDTLTNDIIIFEHWAQIYVICSRKGQVNKTCEVFDDNYRIFFFVISP